MRLIPCKSLSTSTEKAALSILSSILFFTSDINFQSRLFIPFANGVMTLVSSISRLAYLLRNSARFANKLATLAFRILTLNGFTIYSSAPIWSPSNIFCSSPKAVSNNTGIWDVSISFLMAIHSSSPRISGIIMSERISSGQNSFAMINASLPLPQACTLYIGDNELTR